MISLIVENPDAKLNGHNSSSVSTIKNHVGSRTPQADAPTSEHYCYSRRSKTAPIVPNVIPRHFLAGHLVGQSVEHFANVLVSDGRVVLQGVTEEPARREKKFSVNFQSVR